MEKNEIILSIDVSSKDLECCFFMSQIIRTNFENTQKGCKMLLKTAQKYSVSKCALEATGGYEQRIIDTFSNSNIKVQVLNPARVRSYAKGIGLLAKTDKIDAELIGKYARQVKDITSFEISKSERVLKKLVKRRSTLKELIVKEKNRKRLASDEIKNSINRMIKFLNSEFKRIENKIEKLVKEDRKLTEKVDVITKQKGIGFTTAYNLIGLLPELGHIGRNQITALAGLAPYSKDSGRMKGKRFIQGGRFFARKSLYMPAWVAVKYDFKISEFYNSLIKKGKVKKVAIVAVMRKLLIRTNAKLRNHYATYD